MRFRWIATMTYRTNNGPLGVDHAFDELEELQDIVERGPSWDALIDIRIRYQLPSHDKETVESAGER